ncbi:hypothetical protein CLOP_g23539 [Closterium sp. NIES-67]|nr:hypothetical protein CLOP_g23539 [Closterium sp. NIES-67]
MITGGSAPARGVGESALSRADGNRVGENALTNALANRRCCERADDGQGGPVVVSASSRVDRRAVRTDGSVKFIDGLFELTAQSRCTSCSVQRSPRCRSREPANRKGGEGNEKRTGKEA